MNIMKIEQKKRPVKLHLGVGEGDVIELMMEDENELTSYIIEAAESYPNVVWLATVSGEKESIFINDDINEIIDLIEDGYFDWINNPAKLFLFENKSYESAYSVALSMREGNPLCYDSQVKSK